MSEGSFGGESLICFNREFINLVDPKVLAKIARRKIRYIRNYGDKKKTSYMPWQAAVGTDNKQVRKRNILHKIHALENLNQLDNFYSVFESRIQYPYL